MVLYINLFQAQGYRHVAPSEYRTKKFCLPRCSSSIFRLSTGRGRSVLPTSSYPLFTLSLALLVLPRKRIPFFQFVYSVSPVSVNFYKPSFFSMCPRNFISLFLIISTSLFLFLCSLSLFLSFTRFCFLKSWLHHQHYPAFTAV